MYRAFASTAFQTRLAYRGQVWAQLLGGLVRIFAMIAIWKSVYASNEVVDGITLGEMLTYAILASSVLAAYNWEGLVQTVSEQIRSGDVSVYLIKPMSYPLMLLANEIGQVAFRLLAVVGPITLIASLTYGINAPASLFHGMMFPLFWMLAFTILFLMALIAGFLAFWLMTAFSLEWFLQGLIAILSGTFIPLWFFPKAIGAAIYYLPFAWIGFHPVAVYLGKVSPGETLMLFLLGLVWAGALLVAAKSLWARATLRITVQGG